MSDYTVLAYQGSCFPDTFGRKRDQRLWNVAWCYERFGPIYDRPKDFVPRVSKDGRTFLGTVTPKGIAELKALGYSIQKARIETLGDGEGLP